MSFNPIWLTGGNASSGKFQSITNSQTGDTGTWTVPSGVFQIHIEAIGKGGKASTAVLAAGASGCYICANAPVTPGDVISYQIPRITNVLASAYIQNGVLWNITAPNGNNDTTGNGGGTPSSPTFSGVLYDICVKDSSPGVISGDIANGGSSPFGHGAVAILPSSAGECIIRGGLPGGGAAYARNGSGLSVAQGNDGLIRITFLG